MATTEEILAKYGIKEEKKPTVGDRAVDALIGAIKNTIGSVGSALSTSVQSGQSNLMREEELKYERDKQTYAKMLADNMVTPGKWDQRVLDAKKKDIETTGRMLEVGKQSVAQSGLVQGANKVRESSSNLMASGAKDIAQAKEGLGGVGQFVVDAGVAGTQLAGDMLVGAMTGGVGALPMMAVRSFGAGAEEARQAGASLDQQVAYGFGNAALGVAAEKIANVASPFKNAFKAGLLDEAIEEMTKKLGQSAAGKITASAFSEFSEELVEAVIQPVLQRAAYDPNATFNLGEALYQAAIGGVLGGAGGAVDVLSRNTAKTAQQTTPAATTSPATGQMGVDTTRNNNSPQGLKTPSEPDLDAGAKILLAPLQQKSEGNKAPTAKEIYSPENIVRIMVEQQKTAPEVGTTSVDTNPETHTKEENRRITEYVNATNTNLTEWINRVRTAFSNGDTTATKMKKILGEVKENTANAIRAVCGVDVTGFKHMIDGSAIKHIDERHGEFGKADSSMTAAEDIARVEYILENFDGYEQVLNSNGSPDYSSQFRDRNNKPAPMVRFYKKVDGTYYVVEAVPDSADRKLHIVSAYMKTNDGGINQVLNMEDKSNLQLTSETPLDPVASVNVNSNIPQVGDSVNFEATKRRTRATRDTMPDTTKSAAPVINAQSEPPQSSSNNYNISQSENLVNFGATKNSNSATSEPYAPTGADTSTVRPGRSEPAPVANPTVPQTENAVNSGTVGANVARMVDVPMYDAQGNPISRFASNMMGAKALPDDVIPMIQQMVEDGELSYTKKTNREVRMRARRKVRENGFVGALEQLRMAVSEGKSDVNTIALGTELLVNAANAGDSDALAEIASLMQTTSTNVGQAMQYFAVLRKLKPESQLYAIQKTVSQLNERVSARKGRRSKEKRVAATAGKSGNNIPVGEWMTKTGELLAKRLSSTTGTKAEKAKGVVDTILNDLTQYAKNTMVQSNAKKSGRTYEERLADLVENLPHYTQAWEMAKARIAQEYQDDPDALAAFTEWANKDVASALMSTEAGMKITVPEQLIQKFRLQTDQSGRDAVMKEIYQAVANQVPSTWKDKWDAWRYMAMLTNPRTHIRNILGNTGFQPVRVVKNEVAALLERVFNVEEKTKAFVASPAMYRAAWNDFDNVSRLLNGNRYSGIQSEIESRRPIFKTKALEGIRKGNSTALDLEDAVFKRFTYADSLAGYLTANGIKGEQLDAGTVQEGLLAKARDYAAAEALKATYQDNSVTAKKTEELAKVAGTVGDAILPFKKTPANILARGFEYSPAGLAKALTADLVKVKRGEKTVSEALDAVAAGLTGTGLFGLGAYLFAQGLVTGAQGDDKEDKWEELLGHQGYALELPDGTSVTLDWLAPEALPFFMGVEFMSSIGESGWSTEEIINATYEAVKATANPMMELSMLQGVNDLIESVRYADGAPLSAMIPSVIISYFTQAVPTVLGQLERTSEDVRMTTYTDKNSDMPTDLQYALGRMSARIPVLEFQQIPYIDAWGQEEESGDFMIRLVNSLYNPAYVSKVDIDKVESELQRVYDATGESVFPTRADKSFTVNGETKYLTADEYVKYAKDLGHSSYKMVEAGIATEAYRRMNDKQKAEYLEDLYDYARETAKARAIGEGFADKWVKETMKAQKKTGLNPAIVIVYRDMMSREADRRTQKQAKAIVREAIFADRSLTDEQKGALDDIVISDWMQILQEVSVDYTNRETFTISQMPDGAQSRWERIKKDFKMSAEDYQQAWSIYQDDDLKAAEKRRELSALGYDGAALYTALGKK